MDLIVDRLHGRRTTEKRNATPNWKIVVLEKKQKTTQNNAGNASVYLCGNQQFWCLINCCCHLNNEKKSLAMDERPEQKRYSPKQEIMAGRVH